MTAPGRSLVGVEGTVVPLSTLAAPLSGRPCVLYQVELGLWQRLFEGDGASRETAGAPFLVELTAPGGTLLADPTHARLRLPRRSAVSRRIRLGRDVDLDGRVRALYQRLQREGPFSATVRCSERRLRAGDRVRLVGTLEVVPAAGGALISGYRQPPRRRLLRVLELVG